MLSHSQIWAAIDRLATRHGMTPSGLARRAGLDPTTFNRSKRITGAGRERWPSTESIAKILAATGADIAEFVEFLDESRPNARRSVPIIDFAQAGGGGSFDERGFPMGGEWRAVDVPATVGDNSFALKVTGHSMQPLYRHGATIVVSRDQPARKGDRVVVKTRAGEVMAKVLHKRTSRVVDLASLNPEHPSRKLSTAEVEWIGRIVWASQ